MREILPDVPLYLGLGAVRKHMAIRRNGNTEDIGIDPSFGRGPHSITVDGDREITPGATVFRSVTGRKFLSDVNSVLLEEDPVTGKLGEDAFGHEESLIISEGGGNVLFSACSHRGIVNILDRAEEIAGTPMDAVVGGFHLSNPRDGGCVPDSIIEGVSERLLRDEAECWTGHCTGDIAYGKLKTTMGKNISRLGTGLTLNL